MAVKTFNTRIRLKEDTFANWTRPGGQPIGDQNQGLILLSGELGFDKDNQNFKIGDGTHRWDELKYVIGNSRMINYLAHNPNDDAHLTYDGSNYDLGTDLINSDPLNVCLAKLQYQVNSAISSGVTDVKINNTTSVVSSHIANLSVNGTYNSDTNKLATVSTVTSAIGDLDVNEFPIGELTNIVNSSNDSYDSIRILSISENDGIVKAEVNGQYNLYVDIDSEAPYTLGEYNEGHYKQNNALATIGSITNALSGLSASNVQAITSANASSGTGTTITLKGISQTNGRISQGSGTSTITIGAGALKISGYGATSSGSIPVSVGTSVFAANDTADSTLSFSNAFVLSSNNKTIGLRTNQPIDASNNIATMNDIASLSGAMHFVGSIDKVHNSIPSSGKYYTASIGGTTYYLHVSGSSGAATAITPSAGDTLIASGTNINVTPLETGDMVVYSGNTGASVNVVQTNMTIGTESGQIAPNDGALTSGRIIVSTSNGIASSSYSTTDIASHAIGVASNNGIVTVTDTLTVGGTAQSTGTQSFTITGDNGISASSSGNAITIGHTNSSYTPVNDLSALKIKINSTGHIYQWDALTNSDLGQGLVQQNVNNAANATDIAVTFTDYQAVNGGVISLGFKSNVPAGATLNINSKGAKPILWNNTALVDGVIKAGDRCVFMYNANRQAYYLLSIERFATQSNAADTATTAINVGSGSIAASSVQTVLGTLANYAVNTQNANSLALSNKEYFSTADNQTIKFHKVSKTGDYNDLNNKLIEGKNIEISSIANADGYIFYDYAYNTTNTTRVTIASSGYGKYRKMVFELEFTAKTSSTQQRIFSCVDSDNNLYGIAISGSGINKPSLYYNGEIICQINTAVVNGHKYYVNGELDGNENAYLYVKDLSTNEAWSDTHAYSLLTSGTLYSFGLFTNSQNTNGAANGTKIHYAKLWIGNKLKAYCLPAKKIADDTIGFYNIVNDDDTPFKTATTGAVSIQDANERQENIINALVGNINYTTLPNTVPTGAEPMNDDVDLHKIAKTGRIVDAYQSPIDAETGDCEDEDMLIFNCGSSTTNTLDT